MSRSTLRFMAWAFVVVIFALDASIRGPVPTVRADTVGTNTDVFEAGASIWSPWWNGYGSLTVNQRYGCTTLSLEDYAPECPGLYWHQGIDIDTRGGSINLTAAIEGTVADSRFSGCQTCATLGYLGIRTLGGNVIYLLHGDATAGFRSLGVAVHVGDPVYTTASNGASTGYHLHFEVHTSAIHELQQHPGDDINPEGWLWAASHPYGQELASWVGANPDLQAGPELDQLYFNPNDDTQQAHLKVSSGNGLPSSWSAWRDVPLSANAFSYPVVVSAAPRFYDVFSTMTRFNGVKWIKFHNYNPDFGVDTISAPSNTTIMWGGISAVSTGYQPVSPLDRYAWIDLLAIDVNGYPYYKSAQVDLTTAPANYVWSNWSACGSGSIACPPPAVTFTSEVKTAAFAHNNVAVVVRGSDNSVYYTALNHGVWDSSWTKLGESGSYGKFPGGLALTTYDGGWSSAGVVDVFALSNYYGSDTRIFHIRCGYFQGPCAQYWDIPPGQGNFAYGAHATGDFTVTAFSALRDELFVHDTSNNLEHTSWDPHNYPTNSPPAWQPAWDYFGSPPVGLGSELAAFSWGFPDEEITALALNGHRYQFRYANPQGYPCYASSGTYCWYGWYQVAGT